MVMACMHLSDSSVEASGCEELRAGWDKNELTVEKEVAKSGDDNFLGMTDGHSATTSKWA